MKKHKFTPFEEYIDTYSFLRKPINKAAVEQIAKDYMKWSLTDDALVIDDFYDGVGIPKKTFYRWIAKYDFLNAAHQFVKRRLASRREKGALVNKYNFSVYKYTQHIYDDEYDLKVNQYFAKLKASEGNNLSGEKYILLKEMPKEEEDASVE